MLLRQLRRPSSRSVAVIAWQTSSSALLHRSTTRLQPPPLPLSRSTSRSSSPSSNNNTQDDEQQPRRPSLFEQLFPEEAKALGKTTNPKPSWASHLLDDPPSPTSSASSTSPSDFDSEPTAAASRKSNDVPLRAKSMLILSAASKHLLESDFQRLAPQGVHIEDWIGGISRVIQARDPDTLQPLGHYFVLFDRDAAAAAYRGEVERLWQLGKAHIPGAHHGKKARSAPSMPTPPGLQDADGSSRDVAADLRAFTLVPPSQRYYLDVSSGFSRVKIEDLDIGGVAFIDRLADRAGSKHLVLVSVHGGRISVDWLRQAIEEDGKDRNLPWRVTNLENGILPFGKSILKQEDKDAEDFEQSLIDQARRVAGSENGFEYNEEGEGVRGTGQVDEKKYRRYPRFIIPFVDNAEAHRFVRHWHRRHFKIRMSLDDDKPAVWDETRILNTEVLW
ncbi:hypothetical protein F5Y11DRAFT_311396 [Daldinia sp. FL1419]|nr:hypothetical protein F5Y11DRAFT_311396 [Daldinia sp. FL1419]